MSFLYRQAGRVLQGVEDGKASLKTLTLARKSGLGGGKGADQDGSKRKPELLIQTTGAENECLVSRSVKGELLYATDRRWIRSPLCFFAFVLVGRKLYAMVSETLRYKPLLEELVLSADPGGTIFREEHVREKGQAYVMLYEMLLGRGSIQGGGQLKRHLLKYRERLEKCLADAKRAKGLPAEAENEKLLPKNARRHAFPRYARVNLATCDEGVEGVAARLRDEGLKVEVDGVVPSLLVLPSGTDLHDHAMVKDGRLVLQDKSSCFPAEALLDGGQGMISGQGGASGRWLHGGDVIDACAAPGNKTMHLASLLSQPPREHIAQRTSTVFAFDKDPKRLALMQRRVDAAASGNRSGAGAVARIETRLQDFLEVDPTDKRYSNVTAILLDPSCSGSGIVSAPDRIHENRGAGESGVKGGDRDEDGEEERLQRLATFQLSCVLKAMSFPQVKRVCYSTCSVNVEENEAVVLRALREQPDPPCRPQGSNGQVGQGSRADAETSGGIVRWRLRPCLPRWPRRGSPVPGLDDTQVACMVRVDPFEDNTNGFFVALFERDNGENEGSERADDGCPSGNGSAEAGEDDGGRKRKKRRKTRQRKKKKLVASDHADER